MKQKRQMLFQTGIISSLSGKLYKRRSGLPIGPTLCVCSLIQRINRTRSFGDTIKVKRQDNTSGISPLTHNNKTVTDSQDKANILNSQFKSVFTTKDLDSLPQMGESPFPDVQNIQVSPEGICKLLKDINVTKATAPDFKFLLASWRNGRRTIYSPSLRLPAVFRHRWGSSWLPSCHHRSNI